MNKRLSRMIGIALASVLALVMVVAAVPAQAGSLAFSVVTTPAAGATSNFIWAGNLSQVKVASNGDLFAVDQTGTSTVFRSTDGGKNWTAATSFTPALATNINDIAVSPAYATDKTIAVVNDTLLYVSTDNGATFNQLGASPVGAGEIISCLAMAPTYSAGGQIAVGSTKAAAATGGNVYIWGTGGFAWTAGAGLGAGTDITAIAYSPSYPIDTSIVAVGSGDTTKALGTHLYVFVNGTVNAALDSLIINTARGIGDAGGISIASSSLVLPSDYNATGASTRKAFVSTNSALGTDAVYYINDTTPTTIAPAAGDQPSTLAYSGTSAAGTLIAAQVAANEVYRTTTAMATTVTWTASTQKPSGAATYVALASDFATSGKVYTSTGGVEGAVSLATDGGAIFDQIGLINTAIAANGITSAAPSPNYATDKTMFLATTDGAGLAESIWKTTDGGAYWNRVYSFVSVGNTPQIFLSPTYATDKSVYVASILGTAIFGSTNDGKSFAQVATSPAAITAFGIASPSVWYSGQAGGVQKTSNGGWTWATIVATPGAANNIVVAGNGDVIVSNGGFGSVYRSTDAGVTYTLVGAVATFGAGAVSLAVDTNYATNNLVYGAGVGVAGIWRIKAGTDTDWTQIVDGTAAGIVAGATRGIVVNGPLYAADVTAAGAGTGGIVRVVDPTFDIANGVNWGADRLDTGDSLTAVATLTGVIIGKNGSSNVLYSVNTAATPDAVVTYTDAIAAAVAPEIDPLANPAASASSTSISISWGTVTGATKYEVVVSDRSDFLNIVGTYPVAWGAGPALGATTPNASMRNVTVTGLAEGTKYYWKVRACAPVLGAFSVASTQSTQIAAGTNAPTITSPSANGTGPGGTNAPLMPVFSWGSLANATQYDFQLATDAAFANLLVDKSMKTTAYVLDTANPLAYSTTYFWRVRGVGITGATSWSGTTAFTTIAKPVVVPTATSTTVTAPATTVTAAPSTVVTTLPAQTVTQPAPTVVMPESTTPGYVWAIIGVGAVLAIVIIVLIVRTRRAS